MLVFAIGMVAQAQDNPKPSFGKKLFGWVSKIFTKKEKSADGAEKPEPASDAKKEEKKDFPQGVAIAPFEKGDADQNDLPKNVGLSPAEKNQNGEDGNLPKPISLSPGDAKQKEELDKLPRPISLSPQEGQDEARGGEFPKGVALQPSEKEKAGKILPLPVALDPDYFMDRETESTKENFDSATVTDSINTETSVSIDTALRNYNPPNPSGGRQNQNQQTQTTNNNNPEQKKPGYYFHICGPNCGHYQVKVVSYPVYASVRHGGLWGNYFGYSYNSRSCSRPMRNCSSAKTTAYRGPRRSRR